MTVLQAEPLLQWSDALKELIGFIALFLGAGGIGFRYFAMRGADMNDAFNSVAARRAAVLGLVGIGLSLVMVWVELPGLAGRKHLAVGAFVGSDTATQLQIGFLILAFIGFALASAGIKPGWPFAASGVIAGALRQGFLGQWSRLVNPVHSLAAGLWIGTLLVLVVAGITPLLRREISGASRAQRAADMVNRFSPFALTMGGIVVLFGVITAWRHLHVLSNLWSTPSVTRSS